MLGNKNGDQNTRPVGDGVSEERTPMSIRIGAAVKRNQTNYDRQRRQTQRVLMNDFLETVASLHQTTVLGIVAHAVRLWLSDLVVPRTEGIWLQWVG